MGLGDAELEGRRVRRRRRRKLESSWKLCEMCQVLQWGSCCGNRAWLREEEQQKQLGLSQGSQMAVSGGGAGRMLIFFWEMKQCVSFSCILFHLWTSVPKDSPLTDSSIKTELRQARISRPPCSQHFPLLSQSNPTLPLIPQPYSLRGKCWFQAGKTGRKRLSSALCWVILGLHFWKEQKDLPFHCSFLRDNQQGPIIAIIYTLLYSGVIQEW